MKERSMQQFTVTGMTCAHCVRAVTGAIQQVDPTAHVKVVLETGLIETDSAAPRAALAAAICAEGYEIAA